MKRDRLGDGGVERRLAEAARALRLVARLARADLGLAAAARLQLRATAERLGELQSALKSELLAAVKLLLVLEVLLLLKLLNCGREATQRAPTTT